MLAILMTLSWATATNSMIRRVRPFGLESA